jgi:hypothetical protein
MLFFYFVPDPRLFVKDFFRSGGLGLEPDCHRERKQAEHFHPLFDFFNKQLLDKVHFYLDIDARVPDVYFRVSKSVNHGRFYEYQDALPVLSAPDRFPVRP